MSYLPVIPASGLVGWRFLQRTYDTQLQVFSGTAQNARDTQYFRDNIASVKSAEDLVSDRRLLNVALGAFGLENDLGNTYFIRRILQDGTQSEDALSNRLSDKRFREFAAAFGLGPGEIVKTGLATDMEEIANRNLVARFEISVGETDDTMRIALYAQHALADLATQEGSDTAKWFELMSLPPLRTMMETALGLPSAFGQLDIDKQLEVFRDKLSSQTGSSELAQFADRDALERLTVSYLARSQIAAYSATNSSAQTALTLLQSAGTA